MKVAAVLAIVIVVAAAFFLLTSQQAQVKDEAQARQIFADQMAKNYAGLDISNPTVNVTDGGWDICTYGDYMEGHRRLVCCAIHKSGETACGVRAVI